MLKKHIKHAFTNVKVIVAIALIVLDKEVKMTLKIEYKLIWLIPIIIVINNCAYHEISVTKCLNSANKQKCYCNLFDYKKGPLHSAFSEHNVLKVDKALLVIKDKDIMLLCDELYKEKYSEMINRNLYNIAIDNFAPCVCDYSAKKMSVNNENNDLYKKHYYELKCDEGTENLINLRQMKIDEFNKLENKKK